MTRYIVVRADGVRVGPAWDFMTLAVLYAIELGLTGYRIEPVAANG